MSHALHGKILIPIEIVIKPEFLHLEINTRTFNAPRSLPHLRLRPEITTILVYSSKSPAGVSAQPRVAVIPDYSPNSLVFEIILIVLISRWYVAM